MDEFGIPKPKRRKWALWLLLVFVLAMLTVPRLVGTLLKSKLQWMVASHLNARLEIDRLDYIPPYRLVGHNLALVAKGADGTETRLLELKKINLLLAELPTGSGPLVIQRLELDEPAVHVIRADKGMVGHNELTKEPPAPEDPNKPKPKLSEMFRLRHFTLNNGLVTYQDRSGGQSGPEMTWKNLNVDMDTVATSASEYTYKFAAKNAPLATIDANGKFDIDSLLVEITNLTLAAKAEAAEGENPLPPQVQEILKKYQVGGAVKIDGSGLIPMREAADKGTFHAVIELKDARGVAPKWNIVLDRLNTHIDCGRDTAQGPLSVRVMDFDALGRDLRAMLDGGVVTWNPADGRWDLSKLEGHIDLDAVAKVGDAPSPLNKLNLRGRIDFAGTGNGVVGKDGDASDALANYELLVYLRNISCTPPGFAAPVEQLGGGPVRLTSSVLSVENISAQYGNDRWLLTTSRIPLKDLSEKIQVNEIAGMVVFDRNSPKYPKDLGQIFEELSPSGGFSIGGTVNVGPKGSYPRTLYNLNVTTDNGSLFIKQAGNGLALNEMNADVQLERNQVRVRKLVSKVLGGELTASGELKTSEPLRYRGKTAFKEVDMEQLAGFAATPGKPPAKLKGRLSCTADFEGEGDSANTLRAEGEAEILDGEFWEAPIFASLTKHVSIARDALTVGQAAATFTIEHSQVTLKNAAVSAPVLGMQGSGKVGFDGKLDLQVVAAPLADWRNKMRQTGIPLVSNVAGEVLGGIQKVISSATENLLYKFKVTGTNKEPKIEAVPVPALSEGGAKLLAYMLAPKKDAKLLDTVKEIKAQEQQQEQPKSESK